MAPNITPGYVACPACDRHFLEDEAMCDHLATHNEDPILPFALLGRVYLLTRDPTTRKVPCPISPCDATHKPAELYAHLRSVHGQCTPDIPADPLSLATPIKADHLRTGIKRRVDWETPLQPRPQYQPQTPISTGAKIPRQSTSAEPSSGYTLSSSPSRETHDPWSMDTSPSTGRSSTPAASSQAPTPDPHFPVIPESVFVEHPASDDILKYLISVVNVMKDGCIAHTVLQQDNNDLHTELRHCEYPLRDDESHYYVQFRPQLKPTKKSLKACWSCWCPYPWPDVHHGDSIGRACIHEDHQDFWRGIVYLIWACTALRDAVFGFLRVDPTLLRSTSLFAQWLLKSASKVKVNRKVTNLVAIVYAYARLQEDDALPPGPLDLDGKHESPRRFHHSCSLCLDDDHPL
ncbi:hypothetical protein FPV67DRAFT_1678290 [Lyophyllum atratum]|nr:hypothetical protein FPV67DRAFT_1678290 [Lyophyllum atratum]